MTRGKGYVSASYLETAANLIRPIKERSYALLHLRPGHAVLDVGCGPGSDTVRLAQLVGSTGRVVGVDQDAEMVAQAESRAREAGVYPWTTHWQADAASLPLEDGAFDACRCERLFQHLPDPQQAFAEMLRVARPGAWLVAVDTDTGTVSVHSGEVDIERRLARFYSDHRVRNRYSGRQLYGHYRRNHLADITVEVWPVFITDYGLWRFIDLSADTEREAETTGAVTPAELQRWHADQERIDAEGSFFASFSMVVVAGRKSG